MNNKVAIIAFSHLRWNFVYQRPQHVLSRLAEHYPVYFIEEPVFSDSEPAWEFSEPVKGVTICRPQTPCTEGGFSNEQLPYLRALIRELRRDREIDEYMLWFYTPMALPAADELQPRAIIYDCMDELSAFWGAPPELVERERQLLNRADLVFTGGPSIYRAKKDLHRAVYCFPSSVDEAHFAQAKHSAEPADQAPVPRPRLGFFGVIDERLDLDLLQFLSAEHPDWNIVMVGPVVKIDPRSLPQAPNLHYFGQRQYAELPSYLAGWDICILPFARNRSTQFISPTKTLEYMAAEKMIVSTPITDVAESYGSMVFLGENFEEFGAACDRALHLPREERTARVQAMHGILSRTSWASTAAEMQKLISATLSSKAETHSSTNHAGLSRRSVPEQEGYCNTIIIGAGPTGLSAAYHSGPDTILLEQNDRVGGWCRSIEADGFTFDYAGHIMFSADPYVHQLYQMLLGDNVHWQDREAWIYSKNVFTRYPFQGSLYGLPPAVIRECITGAIEARFGPLKSHNVSKTNGHAPSKGTNGTNGNGHCKVTDCCADGILEASVALGKDVSATAHSEPPRNFEEFIYRVWGAGIAKHFAIPYNRKLWAVPLHEMETSWLGGRVPLPDLEEMIEGALSPSPKPMGPNARFGYPLRGGFQALMDAWIPHLKGKLRLNSRVERVTPSRHKLRLSNGEELGYRRLISTMPLPVLIRQMGEEVPASIRAASESLRHVSVRCVHLGIGRERITDKHWIYYPEDTVFHRIFVQGNASPYCNPPGGFGLTCEITYSPSKPLPCDGAALIDRCIEDCRKVGLLDAADPILTAAQCDLPYAYVVYDHARAHAVAEIREWLQARDISLAGRYSEWEYYNSDHAFLAGRRAAEQAGAKEAASDVQTWAAMPSERFQQTSVQ